VVLYRVFLSVLFPVATLIFVLRVLQGRESWSDWRERNAQNDAINSGSSAIWLHAASVGELTSVRPVVEKLRDTGRDFVITCNSITARNLARSWGYAAQLAPIDLMRYNNRFLRLNKIHAHITVESEIWPNRILQAKTQGPVIMLSARMSKKTARGWARFGTLARRVFRAANLIVPQNHATIERLLNLGVRRKSISQHFDLKAMYHPPSYEVPDFLRAHYEQSNTLMAASTHEGEDTIVLSAYDTLCGRGPYQLILAPRHPERAMDVLNLAKTQDPNAILWTTAKANQTIPQDTRILVVDTIGEMPLFYEQAKTCFVGGSLIDRGGHTPYEPLYFGCRVLHGPYVRNFSEIYPRLDDSHCTKQITNAQDLSDATHSIWLPCDISVKSQMNWLITRIIEQLPKPSVRL
jgi:3-deoxy-D-manno-octulosonic-acid transferase